MAISPLEISRREPERSVALWGALKGRISRWSVRLMSESVSVINWMRRRYPPVRRCVPLHTLAFGGLVRRRGDEGGASRSLGTRLGRKVASCLDPAATPTSPVSLLSGPLAEPLAEE